MSQKIKNLVSPYQPREWARELHSIKARYRTLVVHRSAGKTHWAVNELLMKALQDTSPNSTYIYLSPHKTQSKRNVWQWFRYYLSHIPQNLLYFNEAELRIVLPNKATIWLLGANEPDTLRGLHLSGAVLDEVAQMPHNTWREVIFPTLQAKKGWCVFIGTPKGKNLFYDLYQIPFTAEPSVAKDWFSVLKTVEDTGIYNADEIAAQKTVVGDDAFEQEYLCSFTAAIKGAFYGKTLDKLQQEGRMVHGLYDPSLPVYTAWDLGTSDATSIWFAQIKKGQVNIIDFFEDSDEPDLQHYIQYMVDKGYKYEATFLPHDAGHRISGMAQTRYQQIKAAGLKPKLLPKLGVMDGINAVRSLLPKCYFDMSTCDYGVKCLTNYRAKYNERMGVLMAQAVHDESSHAADAFRYLAMGIKDPDQLLSPIKISGDYNIFSPHKLPQYDDYDIYKV